MANMFGINTEKLLRHYNHQFDIEDIATFLSGGIFHTHRSLFLFCFVPFHSVFFVGLFCLARLKENTLDMFFHFLVNPIYMRQQRQRTSFIMMFASFDGCSFCLLLFKLVYIINWGHKINIGIHLKVIGVLFKLN